MTERTIFVLLSAAFFLVVASNALYFTGVVGNFGAGTGPVDPPNSDDELDPPDAPASRDRQDLPDAPTAVPRPSASQPEAQNATAFAIGPRDTVLAAALRIEPNWGRNPMLTPLSLIHI